MNQLHVLYFFIGFGLSAAQCTLPIDEDTIVQVVVGIESGEDPADITLNHIWTNCLAAGVEEDTYRFATLTVQYINANSQVRKAIFDFRCKPDESWDRHGTGSTGNVVMDNSTMTGCRECSSSGSDSDDHHCLRKSMYAHFSMYKLLHPFDVNDMYEVSDTCSIGLTIWPINTTIQLTHSTVVYNGLTLLCQYYSNLETSGFALGFPNYCNTSKSV